jgi:hypothetical protein
MSRAFQQDAQRLQHVWLIIGNENACHVLTVNRVSCAVSMIASQIGAAADGKMD